MNKRRPDLEQDLTFFGVAMRPVNDEWWASYSEDVRLWKTLECVVKWHPYKGQYSAGLYILGHCPHAVWSKHPDRAMRRLEETTQRMVSEMAKVMGMMLVETDEAAKDARRRLGR